MNLFRWFLMALMPPIVAFSIQGLDHIIRLIELQINIHSGVFSCVFWDVSPPHNSYDDTLDAILNSKGMENVVKYVVHGTKIKDQDKVRWRPSLVIIQAGCNVSYLEENDTKAEMSEILNMLESTTKLFVLVDSSNVLLVNEIMWQIYSAKFSSSVFYDSESTRLIQCNGLVCYAYGKVLNSIYIFTLGRLWYKGYPITYLVNSNNIPIDWNKLWMNETAKYLHTEAIEYQHNCSTLSGSSFSKCTYECRGNQNWADITLIYLIPTNVSEEIKDYSKVVFTTIPLQMQIAVPRDRPLNVAELLVMPFAWQVWILLILIFVVSEVIKYRFPQVFTNDPTLLAVCGFEKSDLNQAGRWEKLLFLSLITLMFFMTNAFETKVVSLMISTPSIQKIQTLEDLAQSDLRFHEDLESNPHFADNSIIGSMVVQGEPPQFSETFPGVAVVWYSEMAEVRLEISFDFERMQPFYVLLDYEFNVGPEAYRIRARDCFAEAFRYVHSLLVESGSLKWFKTGWKCMVRRHFIGRRPRKVIENKVELDFKDMQPAWMVAIVGFIVSTVGFIGEHVYTYFKTDPLRKLTVEGLTK